MADDVGAAIREKGDEIRALAKRIAEAGKELGELTVKREMELAQGAIAMKAPPAGETANGAETAGSKGSRRSQNLGNPQEQTQ